MGREIKFRAKKENRGDWVYGELHLKSIHPHIHNDFVHKVNIDVDTIGQFTGVKDKNGKDIYEGDIVKSETYFYGKRKESIGVVEWNDDIPNDSFGEPLTKGYCFMGSNINVIGNIYDDSELLKK